MSPRPYKPRTPEVEDILRRALGYVNSVPYNVTARWVFYRLLQDGTLKSKADYKKLLSYLSKARKGFYGRWHPSTLSDDTRAAKIRGDGFDTVEDWVKNYAETIFVALDHWNNQPSYVEVWYEASAMAAQFDHYLYEDISQLAFHGHPSIPEKWKGAARLVERWLREPKPIIVLYYGDLDEAGLTIPESAREDVEKFACHRIFEILREQHSEMTHEEIFELYREKATAFLQDFTFERVGLNDEHVGQYGIPENPERLGTYQWEGLDDQGALELIDVANKWIDHDALDETTALEDLATEQVRRKLRELLETPEDETETDEEFWGDEK